MDDKMDPLANKLLPIECVLASRCETDDGKRAIAARPTSCQADDTSKRIVARSALESRRESRGK